LHWLSEILPSSPSTGSWDRRQMAELGGGTMSEGGPWRTRTSVIGVPIGWGDDCDGVAAAPEVPARLLHNCNNNEMSSHDYSSASCQAPSGPMAV